MHIIKCVVLALLSLLLNYIYAYVLCILWNLRTVSAWVHWFGLAKKKYLDYPNAIQVYCTIVKLWTPSTIPYRAKHTHIVYIEYCYGYDYIICIVCVRVIRVHVCSFYYSYVCIYAYSHYLSHSHIFLFPNPIFFAPFPYKTYLNLLMFFDMGHKILYIRFASFIVHSTMKKKKKSSNPITTIYNMPVCTIHVHT